jgi:Fe-S-cluster-containing dehydrogenase component/multisubunit Na+/H+ antiporter MnhB subunit
MAEPQPSSSDQPVRWAKVIDHQSCIGCHACTTACKSENEVPLGVTRTYVKYADVGVFPQTRRAFQVTRCNQCSSAPCTHACPTRAMFVRADGIVDFDKSSCIGCKACIAACPYDAIFINPEDHSAEKCNFCAHRLDVGLEPACVVVCPTEAILIGDLNDPSSRLAHMVGREAVTVRRPEKDTQPKLFYRGAHQATLDPLAARRPPGGIFMWSEQRGDGDHVVSGHPSRHVVGNRDDGRNSSAAALLSYDVAHRAPWDWRVSLYTLTKGVAAGSYLVGLLLVLLGISAPGGTLFALAVPLVALAFLALTGAVLIADLEHPARFYMIFTRPQWRSWLVKGAFILMAYGAVLAAHAGLGLAGRPHRVLALAALGAPLAVATAVYTAYLFAQAKARDLWQNPLLPPHLLVQAILAGAASLLPLAALWEPAALRPLAWILAAAAALHALLVAGEVTLPHSTAHARLATQEMVSGRHRAAFRFGLLASSAAIAAVALPLDLVATTGVALVALGGLFAFEHAYVQAGQSVPLA